MATFKRREFLTTTGLLAFAPTLPLRWPAAEQAEEYLYAGKPFSYWLALLMDGQEPAPDTIGIEPSYVLPDFGSPGVPLLIGALARKKRPVKLSVSLHYSDCPAAIRQLNVAMKHGDRNVRATALDMLYGVALGVMLRPAPVFEALWETLPALADAVRDEDQDFARKAARFLDCYGPLIDPTGSAPIGTLDAPEPILRAHAVRRLGWSGLEPDDVIDRMVAYTSDSAVEVRRAAAEILSKYAPEHQAIVPIFVEYVQYGDHSGNYLYHHIDRVIVKALPALREAVEGQQDENYRHTIVQTLEASKTDLVLPLLIEILNDESASVRRDVTSALGEFERTDLAPHLVRSLQDVDASVRGAARDAFQQHPALAMAAFQGLATLLVNGSPAVQTDAALALTGLGPQVQEVIPALQKNLRHADGSVRISAAVALAWIDSFHAGICEELLAGVDLDEDRDWVLLQEACEALEQIGSGAEAFLPQVIERLQMSRSTLALETLIRVVRRLGPDASAAIPSLIDLLREPRGEDVSYWEEIPAALGRIGPQAIPALLEVVRDGPPRARGGAVIALGFMGRRAKRFVPWLIQRTSDGDPLLRRAATIALKCLGPEAAEAMPTLRALLRDRDFAVRCQAVLGLGLMGPHAEVAVPDLASLLDEPFPDVQALVAKSLMELGPAGVQALLDALGHEDVFVRSKAIDALGQVKPTTSAVVQALAQNLNHPEAGIRVAAATALGGLGCDASLAIPQLVTACEDPYEIVRLTAKDALLALQKAQGTVS